MLKVFESLTCRIALLVRKGGRAELTVSDKEHPERRPFRHEYDWGLEPLWQRDLDTLVGATGAKEVDGDAA